MSEQSSGITGWPLRWVSALFVAGMQNGLAIYAVYSSSRDVLSDGACLGGVFGSLLNIVILAVVLIWGLFAGAKSLHVRRLHPHLFPLLMVGLSSLIAVFIGMNAALRCTV